jgi:hypothetical protein
VQIRIIANPKSADKTVISFHQEKLKDANERENMKRYWEEAAANILEKINSGM